MEYVKLYTNCFYCGSVVGSYTNYLKHNDWMKCGFCKCPVISPVYSKKPVWVDEKQAISDLETFHKWKVEQYQNGGSTLDPDIYIFKQKIEKDPRWIENPIDVSPWRRILYRRKMIKALLKHFGISKN